MGILKSSKDYASVTFSDESLKVAHLKISSSQKEVVNILRRDIRGLSEDELPKALAAALSDLNLRKPRSVCVISANIVTTKNIEIPSLDPAEIKSIINLQAGRHTPYSREEIVIDYVNIGVYQRNYSKVLLVIVNRNVLKKQLMILEHAGLKPEKVFFASESIARFYSKALNLLSSEIPTGIININNQFTDFTIAFKGTVIACRSLPIGAAHLKSSDVLARDNLVAELKKSIESYQSEDIEKIPDTFILTGDQDYIAGLQSVLKEALKVNVKIVPYLDKLRAGSLARKATTELNDDSFLEVIAPALAFQESHIDLLPEEIKMQRSIEEQGKEITKSGIFAVALLILICALFFNKVYAHNAMLDKLKTNYEVKRKEAQALERISAKTRIIKDYLNSRMMSLDALNELYHIIPEEIYLSSLSVDEEGAITIQGTSESMSQVFSLVTALENSVLFKSVKTKSTTAKKERGKDVAAFEVVFRLESAKDDEGEISEEEPVAAQESIEKK